MKEKIILLDAEYTEVFFIDSTFKIIFPHYRPYKLLVLAGLPKNQRNSSLICFILIKYLDEISYDRLFDYLNQNYNFKSKFIMTGF